MVWLIVAGTGLAVLAKAFAGLFVALKYAGAAYLLYVAWRMATAPVATRARRRPPPRAAGGRFSARCR